MTNVSVSPLVRKLLDDAKGYESKYAYMVGRLSIMLEDSLNQLPDSNVVKQTTLKGLERPIREL